MVSDVTKYINKPSFIKSCIIIFRMWMLEWLDGTGVPAQLPTELAWEAHMAPCTSIYDLINSPTRAGDYSLDRLTMPFHMALLLVLTFNMDSAQDCVFCGRSLTPLHGECPPGFADSSVRTHTGNRCNLLSCFETLPVYH